MEKKQDAVIEGSGLACKAVIILPILNEVDFISDLLEAIYQELSSRDFLICIIDDGSTDGTLEKVQSFKEKHADRLHLIQRKKTAAGCQRGSALLDGLKWAISNEPEAIFIEMDGDLSHQPEELHTGIKIIEDGTADAAIGSKYLPGSKIIGRSVYRSIISLINSYVMRLLLSSKITDYSNGYRFYNEKAAQVILSSKINNDSPIYLSEIMAIWLKAGIRIEEFPGTYIGRKKGKSKVKVVDLLKGFRAVFSIAWRYHFKGF